MAIAGIDPKCYILALFVRDDGIRFLLGDDPYEFKDKQLHFQPNTVANDVVEVQGNDGYLLAGQVRRPGTQSFDGYVCNGTNSKAEVEVKRREFLQFFRRSHFYKVIYVFPNGTAIQRKQGFLVDDPTVQELYQQYPEYHVALNFEDVNYYTYEEDDQGQEIYAKEAIVPLAGGGATGGLIWDEYGVVWEEPWSDLVSVSGSEMQIENEAGARAPIQELELQGDTYQNGTPTPDAPIPVQTVTGEQTVTVTGKNLYEGSQDFSGTWANSTSWTTDTETYNGLVVKYKSDAWNGLYKEIEVEAGKTYTFSSYIKAGSTRNVDIYLSGGSATFSPRSKSISITTEWQRYSITFAVSNSGTVRARIENTSNQTTPTYVCGYQLEESGSMTVYEPHQSQSYVINLGKNLIYNHATDKSQSGVDMTMNADGTVTANGNGTGTAFFLLQTQQESEGFAPGTYTIKCHSTLAYGKIIVEGYASSDLSTKIIDVRPKIGVTEATFTLIAPDTRLRLSVVVLDSSKAPHNFDNEIIGPFQLEVGSATSYAPYFTPIELCKIGDYQDYIYKEGDNWYLHKETDKVILTGSLFTRSNIYVKTYQIDKTALNQLLLPAGTTNIKSDYFHCVIGGTPAIGEVYSGNSYLNFNYDNVGDGNGLPIFRAWVDANKPMLYGVLATPTDTQITDATLVAQLDALGAMRLFIGENNLLVSATGTNLPATLEFSYPTKFAAIGAEWEEGGTKGATIVDVNAIDNTYPVWELTGPAVNPTLSVLTTNTTLTYNGTITASQKLVIDMFNKTATLNGTSVIGNVSGDFVYMAPGTNRIAYTAGNTDAPDSTIYWQEVVG